MEISRKFALGGGKRMKGHRGISVSGWRYRRVGRPVKNFTPNLEMVKSWTHRKFTTDLERTGC